MYIKLFISLSKISLKNQFLHQIDLVYLGLNNKNNFKTILNFFLVLRVCYAILAEIWHRLENIQAFGDFSNLILENHQYGVKGLSTIHLFFIFFQHISGINFWQAIGLQEYHRPSI
jgi:hypothetical protein